MSALRWVGVAVVGLWFFCDNVRESIVVDRWKEVAHARYTKSKAGFYVGSREGGGWTVGEVQIR